MHEFGRERREAIRFSLRVSPLNADVLPLHVPKLSQSLPECLEADQVSGMGNSSQESYPRDFLWLLRDGGARHGEEIDNENDREPDPPHGHLGGGWLPGV